MRRISLFLIIVLNVTNLFCQDIINEIDWYKKEQHELLINPNYQLGYKSSKIENDVHPEIKNEYLNLLLSQQKVFKGEFDVADSILNSFHSSIEDVEFRKNYWKSIVHFKKMNFDSTLIYTSHNLDSIHSIDSTLFYQSLKVRGNAYKKSGFRADADSTYYDALYYFERTNDSLNYYSVLSDIASNLYPSENDKKIELFTTVRAFYHRQKYRRQEGRASLNLANKTRNEQIKTELLNHAESVFEDCNDNYYLIKTNLQKASNWINDTTFIYDESNPNYSILVELINTSEILAKESNYSDRLAEVYYVKSSLLSELDEKEECLKYELLAATEFESFGNLEKSTLMLEFAAESEKDLGNYQGTYAHLKKYLELNSKSNNRQNRTKKLSLRAIHKNHIQEKNKIAQEGRIKEQKSTIYMLIMAVILAIGILSFGVYRFREKRRHFEKEIEEKEKQAELEANNLVKEHKLDVITTSIKSEEKVRKRLAAELHDGVGSDIIGLAMQLENKSPKDNVKFANHLRDIYQDLRKVSHELGIISSDSNTLAEIIENYVDNLNKSHKVDCQFRMEANGEQINLNEEQLASIYRIVQELSTNMIKHSEAEQYVVKLDQEPGKIALRLYDNGKGFNARNVNYGMGIRSVQNRVKKLNGTIQINSTPEVGTEIIIKLPI